MNDDATRYTSDWARNLAADGDLDQAVEIYENLVARWPNRDDLVQELAEVERRRRRQKLDTIRNDLQHRPGEREMDMRDLFAEWMHLLMTYKRIKKLNNVKDKLGG